jgi:hypothetical protein
MSAASTEPLKIVILGLSITSSWGNGHATTYRGLVRELARRGHDVLFLERDVPWYASHRDLPEPPDSGRTVLYADLPELQRAHARDVARGRPRDRRLLRARRRGRRLGAAQASGGAPPSTTSTRPSRWRGWAAAARAT